jgi:hypothetical protein
LKTPDKIFVPSWKESHWTGIDVGVEAQYVAKNFGEFLKVKNKIILYLSKTQFGWSLLRYYQSDSLRRKIRNEELFLFAENFTWNISLPVFGILLKKTTF